MSRHNGVRYANAPEPLDTTVQAPPSSLRTSIGKLRPMLGVPDVEATVAWYRSIGFELTGSHESDGGMDWACVSFGDAELMFAPSSEPWRERTTAVSFWITTDRLDDLYALFRATQLERSRATLAGEATELPEVRFTVDLYAAFYGQREFGIRDPNGIELMFAQPVE